jgi:hypothetical protein
MKNFRIDTSQPALNEADLSAGQNFGKLLKAYHVAKLPFFKAAKLWVGGASATVTIVASVIVYTHVMGNISHRPFVNPPIPAANIIGATYILEAQNDSVITYPSGSKIHVPANAFLDKNGNVVKGKVELNYREFHKTADIFLSGIPMDYDSAGNNYAFESAGMLEVGATQDGKPLRVNPNAPITISMVSYNLGDSFNSYYLDTISRQWKYIAQSNYLPPQPAGPGPGNLTAVERDSNATNATAPIQKEITAKQREISKLETQKPVVPKKMDLDKPRFAIKVDEREFPELGIYNGLKFQVEDKDYKPEMATIVWEDVKLNRIKGSINYEITFSKPGQQYYVIATPVFGTKEFAAAQSVYEQKLKEYTAALSQKKSEAASLRADLEAKAKAVDFEMQQEMGSADSVRKILMHSEDQVDLIYRTFSLAYYGFGYYNCDRARNYPLMQVDAEFIDAKTHKPLQMQRFYLVEKERNIVYQFGSTNFKKLRYSKNTDYMVWGVTGDLKLAIARPDAFKAAKKTENNIQLELNIIDKSFQNTEEARQYLEI